LISEPEPQLEKVGIIAPALPHPAARRQGRQQHAGRVGMSVAAGRLLSGQCARDLPLRGRAVGAQMLGVASTATMAAPPVGQQHQGARQGEDQKQQLAGDEREAGARQRRQHGRQQTQAAGPIGPGRGGSATRTGLGWSTARRRGGRFTAAVPSAPGRMAAAGSRAVLMVRLESPTRSCRPGWSVLPPTAAGCPCTVVAFVEARSRTLMPDPLAVMLACRRDTRGSSSATWQSGDRPIVVSPRPSAIG
jgi:hypothetical protein